MADTITQLSGITVVANTQTAAFNPSKFLTNFIGLDGFSRTAHFDVTIPLAQSQLLSNYGGVTRILNFSAVSANIPGTSLDLADVRRGGTTYKEYFPTGIDFSDLSITFLSDGKGSNLNYLKDWIDSIYDYTDVNNSTYQVSYRDDYTVDITLRHYNPEANKILTFVFKDAFPTQMANISMNWGALNEILTIPVDFKYRMYTTTIVSAT